MDFLKWKLSYWYYACLENSGTFVIVVNLLRSSLGLSVTLLDHNNSVYSECTSIFPTPSVSLVPAVHVPASNALASIAASSVS